MSDHRPRLLDQRATRDETYFRPQPPAILKLPYALAILVTGALAVIWGFWELASFLLDALPWKDQ